MKLPSSIKKIAIFRALQLGDLLCSIPAIRSLRFAFPEAKITLLSLPWAESLVSRFPGYFDDFIHFPGYPGLPEQTFEPKEFLKFLAAIQNHNYDLVLQMQGNGNLVNPMVELFGSTCTAGFFYKELYYPDNGLFVRYPEDCHEIHRHLKLMQFLGIREKGDYLEFPLYDSDFAELEALKLPIQYGQYVCVHPGSRGSWRQWPPAHFAALADHCASLGFKVILTGTKEEMEIVDQVSSLMQQESIIVAGKTSLGAVAALIKNAFAIISNCTGVSHIAAALKTPGIVISMDGEPGRWAPLDHDLHRTIDWTVTPEFDLVFNQLQQLLAKFGKGDQVRDNIGLPISGTGEQITDRS